MNTKSIIRVLSSYFAVFWIVLFIVISPIQATQARNTHVTKESVAIVAEPKSLPTDVEVLAPIPTVEVTKTVDVTVTPTEAPEPTRLAQDWKTWPVVPDRVSNSIKKLYQEGIVEGNNPRSFSKLGDCQNVPGWFLSGFEGGSYVLDDASLQETIDWYSPSFKRESIAVRGGMNVTAVQVSLWTTDPLCNKSETPLECEIRINNPSVVLISYEELWDSEYGRYASDMESLVKYVLSMKVVPILATTATNEKVNQMVALIAVKYDIPVWNLWAALQPLTNHGVSEDGFHITKWGNIFDLTSTNKSAWAVRNETALKSLDAVKRYLQE